MPSDGQDNRVEAFMHEAHTPNDQRQYVVVLRGPTPVTFHPEAELAVERLLTDVGLARLTMRTRYVDRGLAFPLPGHLWIDVRGPAPDLRRAATVFGNAALTFI